MVNCVDCAVPFWLAPVHVYGAVPPLMFTEIVPLEAPQEAVVGVPVAVIPPVCGTVTGTVVEQPLASVTTILYVPPAKPEMVNGSVCAVPLPAADLGYGPVPPVTSIVTEPFAAPQVAADGTAEAVIPFVCGTVALTVVEQPLASVITILYVPPAKALIVNCPVCEVPLPAPVQEYGAAPPVITTVIEPFEPPQVVGVVVAVAENCPAPVTVAVVDFVQPLESVTVTVYVPARRPPISCVVWPFDQRYWYCGVPPDTLRLMVPLAPAQPAGETSVVRFNAGGDVITRNKVAVQNVVRSVTTTVYMFDEILLISCV